LNATANAWHRFAQELDLRGGPIRKSPGHPIGALSYLKPTRGSPEGPFKG
jgi:hypothetical protein